MQPESSCGRCVHNLLLLGPPGVEKSMLARRITTILPTMTLAEALDTTHIHRVAGRTGDRTALVIASPPSVQIDARCSGSHISPSRECLRAFTLMLPPVQPSPVCTSTHPLYATSLHTTTIQRNCSRRMDEGVKWNRSCTDAASAEHPRGGSAPSARHHLSDPAREQGMIAGREWGNTD
jgi:hypothetical protein